MTNNSSSNKDKEFTIPEEIREFYEYEFVCVIGKLKRFVKILQKHLQFFELNLEQFKRIILKRILDEFEDASNLSPEEKEDLIKSQISVEAF